MRLEELFVVEVLNAQYSIDSVVGLDVQHILDSTALRVLVALRNLIALLPVAATLLGEEEQCVVHSGRIDILGEVVVTMAGSFGSDTSTTLLVELVKLGTLDVTHVRDSDDNGIIGIEVFGIELVVEGNNLCTTLVAIFLLHLLQFVFHHLLATLGVVENFLQVGNEFLQVVKLLMQLIDTQTCQLRQTHINDSLRLQFIQIEAFLQVALSIAGGLAVTDDVYHLVDVVDSNNQTFQDVGTLLCFSQIVLGATDGHIMTMLNEILDALLEGQQAGTSLHQCDVIH